MYKIKVDGSLIGIVARPVYIKHLDNGYFGLCEKDDAEGVVFDGTVYTLSEVTLEHTYDVVVSCEYIAATKDVDDLLALVGEAVEAAYQSDLEVIDNV